MKIELLDDEIIGYVKKGRNPHSVEIPIDQIKGIYLYNQTRSRTCTAFLAIGGAIVLLIAIETYRATDGWSENPMS
jgi:hypothetical protein